MQVEERHVGYLICNNALMYPYGGISPQKSPTEQPGSDHTRVAVNVLQLEVYAHVMVRPAGGLPESTLSEYWRSVSVDFFQN
jgi:hypothetical protein